jgi:hypothetical protein
VSGSAAFVHQGQQPRDLSLHGADPSDVVQSAGGKLEAQVEELFFSFTKARP